MYVYSVACFFQPNELNSSPVFICDLFARFAKVGFFFKLNVLCVFDFICCYFLWSTLSLLAISTVICKYTYTLVCKNPAAVN